MFQLKFLFLIAVLVTAICPSPAFAAAQWSLVPRLYVQEEYDDNLFLTETNEQDDLITTISPGINLAYETPNENISLDYEFQRVLYDDFSELDYSGHRGRLAAFRDFGPRFSAGIRDFLIISEDPIELTGITEFERPSIRAGERNRYTRNIVEPEVTFRFNENRSIRVGYRNHLLRNDADNVADIDENTGNALLTYQFNIHHGIEASYEHAIVDYGSTVPPQPPRDFDGDRVQGRYTYHFNPRTSAFVEFQYYQLDYEDETPGFFDYKVYDSRLGFSRDLYENVSVRASGGYGLRDPDEGDNQETFAGRFDFLTEYKRLNVTVYGETGFGLDFMTAESLGFNEFWRVGIDGRYQLLQRLWVNGFFFFLREDFDDITRTDKNWNVRGGLNYQLLRWLFLSFDYEFNKRDSTASFEDYTDNRYFGRLTAQYDIAERFQ